MAAAAGDLPVTSSFTDYRKRKESFEVELAKAESEERKLLERLEREQWTGIGQQARLREARWKADGFQTEAKYLEEILRSLEEKNDVLGETVLQLQKQIFSEREIVSNINVSRFEEQMADIVNILNEARNDYAEHNLERENVRTLNDLDEVAALCDVQKGEMDDLRNELERLKTVAVSANSDTIIIDDDDVDLDRKLTDVLKLFEEENLRVNRAFSNYFGYSNISLEY